MKSILLASKPSNNNQLSVGSQLRRNDSSSAFHSSTGTTTATLENVSNDSNEKEHFNKLFSNSKKQVIRNRCSAKSDVDKVKRATSESPLSDSEQRRLIKSQASDNNGADSEYFESQPLIVDSKISLESEAKSAKLINLRKKNGTTLIFQRKGNGVAQKHPKANEYQELESFKKRRSLPQWPNAAPITTTDTNNSNRHSWYDTDHYPRAIEEVFDETDVSIWEFDAH